MAGEVVAQIGRWLVQKGYGRYVGGPGGARARAGDAYLAVPRANRCAVELRRYQTRPHPGGGDHFHQGGRFAISRVEPGRLWVEPLVAEDALGPILLPKAVTDLCELDWLIDGCLCRSRKGWRLMNAYFVQPLGLAETAPSLRQELSEPGSDAR